MEGEASWLGQEVAQDACLPRSQCGAGTTLCAQFTLPTRTFSKQPKPHSLGGKVAVACVYLILVDGKIRGN